MQNKLITRKQYMDNEYTHADYYGQWVTDAMLDYVVRSVGSERILKSTDKHLNDIPLQVWNNLSVMQYVNKEDWITSHLSNLNPDIHENNRIAHAQRKFSYSLSDGVCVAKAAARKYQEMHNIKVGAPC